MDTDRQRERDRGECHVKTQRHMRKGSHEKTVRDWNYAAPAEEYRGFQRLEEERRGPLSESLVGTWPYQYLVFRILASRTMGPQISFIFKSTSLWYFVMVALGN